MAKIRVAIDGCGALTTETILWHLDQPDFRDLAEVVAVCDVVPERARAAAEAHGVPHWFPDYDEMLAKVECDAVLVIVPHALHADHALRAIRAGRHVYVQKPMAPTLQEAERIVRESRQRGLKVVAAPGQALWPLYRQIRETIEGGEIGKPFLAVPPLMGWGNDEVGFPNDPSWFFSSEAGPLRDHGGYGFQTLVSLLGPVRRVAAFSGTCVDWRTWNGRRFEVTGHDNTAALLDFGGNVFATLPEAWCDTAPGSRFLRVHGLKGAVQTDPETFNHLDILPIAATVIRIGKPPLRLECPLESVPFTRGLHPQCGHVHVYGDILHLVECVRDDREPIASAERGMHFVDAVEAIFLAAREGRTVDLRTTVPTNPWAGEG
ncbi:MAG: Gfo/Idh/MocA family oxidoreductase [Fimbriimonadales bacterium]|nr:Gfo/Idh/MocA family oxidoreductase [Fimbriimonadales bacterium]